MEQKSWEQLELPLEPIWKVNVRGDKGIETYHVEAPTFGAAAEIVSNSLGSQYVVLVDTKPIGHAET
jgi:hypothetical protein